MAHRDQLVNYFASAGGRNPDWIGTEIETFFVNDMGTPISIGQSQGILGKLASVGWRVTDRKGELITEVRKGTSKVVYELGYPNLELAVCPHEKERTVSHSRGLLDELYRAAESCKAYPLFTPVFGQMGNYLAIPDERDATWLTLDGKDALSPLARISAVQFTINVPTSSAVEKLNNLLSGRDRFLKKYPQDAIWRQYIAASAAGYREDRYGGPTTFGSLADYCDKLSDHSVVSGSKLVPFEEADLSSNEAIALFVRSVWWYFRLRRYGSGLCIEVRPIPRRRDECLSEQLEEVLDIMN